MDSYRPSSDNYRPARYDDHGRDPPWSSRESRDGMFEFRAGRDPGFRGGAPERSRRGHSPDRRHTRGREPRRRGPWVPHFPRASERPLLRMTHDSVEDPSLLRNGTSVKFRAPDELTDSDEEEMAQSDDEQQGPSKRIRIDDVDVEGASAPKWSNPDPYTSLPPVQDQSGEPIAKRTDVLRLIRKARLDATSTSKIAADSDDFISFDMGDDKLDTPMDMGNLTSRTDFPAPPPPTMPAPSAAKIPSTAPSAQEGGVALGKRKRGASTGDRPSTTPAYLKGYADKWVLPEWSAAGGENAAPWFTGLDSSSSPSIASVQFLQPIK